MYFHASYTLSPAILHILSQLFAKVSPLDRQLNTGSLYAEQICIAIYYFSQQLNVLTAMFSSTSPFVPHIWLSIQNFTTHSYTDNEPTSIVPITYNKNINLLKQKIIMVMSRSGQGSTKLMFSDGGVLKIYCSIRNINNNMKSRNMYKMEQ